jgi:hypothetical protein
MYTWDDIAETLERKAAERDKPPPPREFFTEEPEEVVRLP